MDNKPQSFHDTNQLAGQGRDLAVAAQAEVPNIIRTAGANAVFAHDEFFFGKLRNVHTRRAYRFSVYRFLGCCDRQGIALRHITPKMVGQYLDEYPIAAVTKKRHLAALRHFFDDLVQRHAVALNPAASVRGERQQVIEGKTPEITVGDARRLLNSIDTSNVVGLRDRAIIATLIYTAARVGAVAKLQRNHFYAGNDQWYLRFTEKGGKSREIPVRHDLQQFLHQYSAVAPKTDNATAPFFHSAIRRERRLTQNEMTPGDIGRMVKRRLKDAELSSRLSAHSFRVMVITNLLEQSVPLEDVQHLAGHSDPRTTRLYDRRNRRVSRNIVERIAV